MAKNIQKQKDQIPTDQAFVVNKSLPVWIIPISGWGNPRMKDAHQRMKAYKIVAEKWKCNIEFSSRLGTFQSYKTSPAVAKEIRDHNEITLAAYDNEFGKDWRESFNLDVEKELEK